jgi:hypothetical protein
MVIYLFSVIIGLVGLIAVVVDNWPNRTKAIESYVRCAVDMLRWSFS